MQITLLTEPQARAVLNHALAGDLAPGDAAADLIRQEVSARRGSPRHFLLGRVCRLAAPVITLDPELVDDVCDDLERQGDILLADGGFLYPAPARIVSMGDGVFRFFCAVPSWRLFAAIEGEWTRRGVRRDCRPFGSIDKAAEALGGVVLPPEVWAGLDRVPPADAEWTRSLNARLAWNPAAAGSLERDEPLEWSGLLVDQDEPRWRAAGSAQLWRARHRWKRWVYAWTAGDSPRTQPFISLHPDEGTRTAFAVARVAERPFRAIIDGRLPIPTIGLPSWLPSAEYRYVSQFGEVTERQGSRATWAIPSAHLAAVATVLSHRLGIDIAEGDDAAGTGAAQIPPPPPAPGGLGEAPPGPPQTARGGLSARARGIIERLGLESRADLRAWLDSDVSGRTRNFGATTRRELEGFLARGAAAGSPGQPLAFPCASEPEDQSDLDGIAHQYGELPIEILGHLPKRLQRLKEAESLDTLATLIKWLKAAQPNARPQYGRVTHDTIIAKVRELGRRGPSQMVFGSDDPPKTAAEVFGCYVDSLGPEVRDIFEKSYIGGATLEQIGQSRTPQVTRERIRQIITREVLSAIPTWGPTARRVFAPTQALLESGSGLAPLDSCLAAAGATRRWEIELLAELAEQPLLIVPGNQMDVAAILDRDEVSRIRRELREEVSEALERSGTRMDAAGVLLGRGVNLPAEDIDKLLEGFLDVQLKGEAAYKTRRRTQVIYVDCLRSGGRPMSAREVSDAVLLANPDEPASPRNVVAHFARSPDVFNVGGWRWVHGDHLGVSRSDLRSISEACLDLVPRSGDAVSVIHLVKRISAAYPGAEAVPPHVIRDEMIHSGLVRGWRMGCDVAWRGGGGVSRTSIGEWIRVVSESLEQPFMMTELVARVAELGGTTEDSVLFGASQSNDLLVLGQGECVSRSYAFPEEADFSSARGYIASLIPFDDVVSFDELLSRVDLSQLPAAKEEPRLVWALARTLDEVESRSGPNLLWRRALGDTTWAALHQGKRYSVSPVFTCRHLASWLKSTHSIERGSFVYALVQEAVRCQHILACGRGWYLDIRTPPGEAMESAIDTTPEFERLVRSDQDFVRDSPARSWLNESRKRRGLFEVWD